MAEPAWLATLAPYKRIWPLILRAIGANGWIVPRRVRTALRAAYVSEKIRHAHLWRVLERCVAELSLAGVPSVVEAGAALAVTVYPEPALRHTHAMQLGVVALRDATHALSPLGLRAVEHASTGIPGSVCLEGPNRELIVLRSSTPESPRPPLPGSPLAIQSPREALASAWDETLGPGAPPLVWAFDVAFATRLGDPERTSSDRLVEEARRAIADALRPDGATR